MFLPGWKHWSLVAKEEPITLLWSQRVSPRYYVVVEIQSLGHKSRKVLFYKSSGEGGKDNEENGSMPKIDWSRYPVYGKSSGEGGKDNEENGSKPVPKGHWYPVYGISPKTNYINKGSTYDMLHPHPLLKAVADALDSEFAWIIYMHPPGEVENLKSAIEYMNKQIGDGIVGAEESWGKQ
jgi:hypothetical protein